MNDNDPRTTAELVEIMTQKFRDNLEYLVLDCGDKSITMTDATESIWGSSGRGAARAVRIIETLAEYGYLEITGRKKRRVTFTAKGHELVNTGDE